MNDSASLLDPPEPPGSVALDVDSPRRSDAVARAPTSFSQRRLWLLDRLLPVRSVYNVAHALRMAGELDVDALRRALNELLRRHEVLRTRFVVIAGEPVQEPVPEVAIPLTLEDLCPLAPAERESEARRRTAEEAQREFSLDRGPIFRARLLRLAPREHWLLLTMHHIVSDAWSAAVLAREVCALYAAFRRGEASPLPELPVQYADFAAWQREWLQGEVLERQLAYWRAALANLPMLELPTDRPRAAMSSYRGGRVSFEVDALRTRALKELSQRERSTLFMTLLASFHVLLYRYTGQEDVAVGAPIAGRRRPELEGLMGFFVNTLVLRGDLSGDPAFREYLQRVRERALEAYAHQDLPFEKLVEELAPRRELSRNPLFQAAFAFHNTAPIEWSLPGLEVEHLEGIAPAYTTFDLTLSVREVAGILCARITYASDLFDAGTIERMGRQWLTMLDHIVDDPDCRVSRLRLMDDGERARTLVAGNNARAGFPVERSVPILELFSAQVRRAPHAIAVRQGELALSYAELDRRAAALAHRLRDLGIAPGSRVALCMERSVEEIVAVLGVSKAGHAYVPLDPSHPPERLAAVLRDAGASAVLITAGAEQALARSRASSARPVIVLGGADAVDARPDPELACSGEDAAYVIYTSGSTGEPKGVVVPQRAVLRLVCDTDYVQLGAGDVVAHLSNPAFDAATFEIWGALLNGACLAVVPRQAVLSPSDLAAALDRHGVTTLFLTTALFNVMARDAPRALTGRTVLFGGEAVEPRWVATALSHGNPGRLLHMYGPTEATTFATWHEVRVVDPDTSSVPIGRPIANTEVYVLDRNGEPVPCGIPGEIHIGGPGLAIGYLGRPDLTAERFVGHPFVSESGKRLYRTGDRARYRNDGAIEFLGRLDDDQVKIRGHRIEPGEVEVALRALPQVRDAVVAVHGDTAETRRLTACVVPSPGPTPTPAELWRELRRTLPEYMVPGAIVLLAAMPLTPNGKLDRRALPDPVDLAEQRTGVHVPPQNPLQQMIAAIWEELLGIRNVGVRDSFFELGGHSLLAAQMMDAVERACGVKIPLTLLFTQPTIAGLAAAIRRRTRASAASITAVNAAGSRPPLFFLHGDFTGGGFYCIPLARALGDDQPFYAIHPHGLDGHAVPESIEAMADERFRALRRMRPTGPYVLGGHCNGAFVALEIARQLVEQGEEVPMVVLLDAKAPQRAASASRSIKTAKRNPVPQVPATPGAINPGHGKRDMFARYRAAVASYEPAPYSGRIVVLRSENTRDRRPDLGWSLLGAGVETYTIPGDHHSSITRHVAETAARIRTCIETAGSP